MEPTPEQIEKVARMQVPNVYNILDVESVDEIDRIALSWFEAWEQVCPRPKPFPMSECGSVAIECGKNDMCDYIASYHVAHVARNLAKRGYLTIDKE